MTATAMTIERAFKDLPTEEQEELLSRLETIVYAEEDADRISQARAQELATGQVEPLTEQEVKERVRARLS